MKRHFQAVLDELESRDCGHCPGLASSKPQASQTLKREENILGPSARANRCFFLCLIWH